MNTSYFSNNESTETIIGTFIGDSEQPFYVIDLGSVSEQYAQWTKLMPRVKAHYAMKCNPDPRIVKLLGKLGCNFDCASRNEIELVTRSNIDPSRIIFSNPCKQKSHIDYAIRNNVKRMTFDSISELSKIPLDTELLIRIHVNDDKAICPLGTKFGARYDEINDILDFAKQNGYTLIGVNFHVGSNCTDPETYERALFDARHVFNKATVHGFNMTTLDIGGGFPSDIEKFEPIAKVIGRNLQLYFSDTPCIIAEPGRYMVEKSHTLVVSVIAVKNDRKYYINDGVYGSFNCVHFDHARPVFSLYTLHMGTTTNKSTLFGPTCDSMDVIGDDYMLPELHIGDRLYIENFGAYTCAAGSNFNGFVSPHRYYIIRTSM